MTRKIEVQHHANDFGVDVYIDGVSADADTFEVKRGPGGVSIISINGMPQSDIEYWVDGVMRHRIPPPILKLDS